MYGLDKAGEGIAVFERAAAGDRRLVAVKPKNVPLNLMLMRAEWRVAYCHLARRDFAASQASLDRLSAAVKQVGSAELQSFMDAVDQVARGDLDRLQNRSDSARAHYQEAVRLFSQSKGTSPKDPSDLFNLLEPKFRIAQLAHDQSALKEIGATYRKFGGRKEVHRYAANWIDDLDAVANQKH